MPMTEFYHPFLFFILCAVLLADHIAHLSVYYFDRIWKPFFYNSKKKPTYQWHSTTSASISIAFSMLAYLTYSNMGPTLTGMVTLLIIHILLIATVLDYKYQIIPDILNYALMGIGLIAGILHLFVPLKAAIFGMIIGYGSLFIINFLFKLIRKKDGMGHGDFKLLAALGAILGAYPLPIVVFIASVLSIVQAIILTIFGSHKFSNPSAFGPSLAASGLLYLFAGDKITAFYIDILQTMVN